MILSQGAVLGVFITFSDISSYNCSFVYRNFPQFKLDVLWCSFVVCRNGLKCLCKNMQNHYEKKCKRVPVLLFKFKVFVSAKPLLKVKFSLSTASKIPEKTSEH